VHLVVRRVGTRHHRRGALRRTNDILVGEQVLGPRALLPLLDRVVLAQGVALELVMAEDAAQVGMAGERHAEKVVDLALVPVGTAPQTGGRRHRLVLGHVDLHPQAVVVRQ